MASALAERHDLNVTAAASIVILYATETGNAERIAIDTAAAAARFGIEPRVVSMADTLLADLHSADTLLIVASTYGEGEPPLQAEDFHATLMSDVAPRLNGKRYAVLALGDRAYPDFCGFGHALDRRLAELGAQRFHPIVECDFDYSESAALWIAETLTACTIDGQVERPSVAELAHDLAEAGVARDQPVSVEILTRNCMHADTAGSQTVHLQVAVDGKEFAYEPGDALAVVPRNDPQTVLALLSAAGCVADDTLVDELTSRWDITTLTPPTLARYALLSGNSALNAAARDPRDAADYIAPRQLIDLLTDYPMLMAPAMLLSLLRPLAPRYYSIASSRTSVGNRADLLVTRMSWQSCAASIGTRFGVASRHLITGSHIGDTLSVVLKPNYGFRLPDDPDRPLVMIGPGTGVAPFRGFLQERRALGARGKNWLLFGHRHAASDFFYRDEWLEMRNDGLLTRLDTAFSRDQPEKLYVQQRLWENRDALLDWLDNGAIIYVCGAIAMGTEVDRMLAQIFIDAGRSADEAMRALRHDKRYLKDVY